jgi:hypothetical protein
MNILLYGLQRSGTNLLEELIYKYTNLNILNNNTYGVSPLHKHFRPHSYYNKIYNTYKHKLSINSFDDLTSHLSIKPEHYFIISKDPYSWFVSYSSWAKQNPKQYYAVDFHYSEEYELFYKRWIVFAEHSDNIHFIRYIDLLSDPTHTLSRLINSIGLSLLDTNIVLPNKVPYSNTFTNDKVCFYQNKSYLNMISDTDKQIISQTVKSDTFLKLNYECLS